MTCLNHDCRIVDMVCNVTLHCLPTHLATYSPSTLHLQIIVVTVTPRAFASELLLYRETVWKQDASVDWFIRDLQVYMYSRINHHSLGYTDNTGSLAVKVMQFS